MPAEIRRALNLKEGDRLAFSIVDEATGQIAVRPIRSVAEMTRGVVTPHRRPEDLKALRDEALEEVAEDILAETPPHRPEGSARRRG